MGSCSSDLLVGDGPASGSIPRAMAINEDGFFIVLQEFPGALMRIHPITGDHTLINR